MDTPTKPTPEFNPADWGCSIPPEVPVMPAKVNEPGEGWEEYLKQIHNPNPIL